jgi:hypothetical protein
MIHSAGGCLRPRCKHSSSVLHWHPPTALFATSVRPSIHPSVHRSKSVHERSIHHSFVVVVVIASRNLGLEGVVGVRDALQKGGVLLLDLHLKGCVVVVVVVFLAHVKGKCGVATENDFLAAAAAAVVARVLLQGLGTTTIASLLGCWQQQILLLRTRSVRWFGWWRDGNDEDSNEELLVIVPEELTFDVRDFGNLHRARG